MGAQEGAKKDPLPALSPRRVDSSLVPRRVHQQRVINTPTPRPTVLFVLALLLSVASMAPSESSILSSFLLPPAPLQTIITLRQFTDLFPRALQSNPAIPKLYRELQHQRAIDTDDVKRNIAAECKRGERQAREVARARRRDEAADSAAAGLTRGEEMDVMMEEDLHGRTGATAGRRKKRTAEMVIEDMEQAERDIEEEIAEIEEETEAVLEDLKGIVGDLSDLRYGRFNKPAAGGEELGQEAVTTLRQLRATCQDIGNG